MPMSVWCDWGSWRSYLLLASAFCNGGDSMRQCSNILFSPTDLPVVSVPLVSVPPLFSPSLQYSKVWARRWRHPNTQNHIASHQAWWTSLPAHVDNLATPNISCLCPAGPLHSTHQLVANHPAFWSRPRANLKLRFVRQNTRSSVNIHVIIHKKQKSSFAGWIPLVLPSSVVERAHKIPPQTMPLGRNSGCRGIWCGKLRNCGFIDHFLKRGYLQARHQKRSRTGTCCIPGGVIMYTYWDASWSFFTWSFFTQRAWRQPGVLNTSGSDFLLLEKTFWKHGPNLPYFWIFGCFF